MSGSAAASDRMLRTEALDRRVEEVMVRRPKTLPVDTRVGELRLHFENPHVRSALLVDGERFAGVIARDDVPASAQASEPAGAYARRDVPTVHADTGVADALAVMDSGGDRRLVVLDAAGTKLLGLLCLDKSGSSFCLGEKG